MSNKRGRYNSKNSDLLGGFSVIEVAEHLGVNRSTVYYKIAAANELFDAVTELEKQKNNTHEKHKSDAVA